MSTHRISGINHVQCDGPSCHEFLEGGRGETARGLWERARAGGWSGRADGSGDWDHLCPECSAEPRLRVIEGGKP